MHIVIDFDGTCVTHEFPKIGKDIGAIPILKELVYYGHKLILFTMRSDISDPKSNSPEITCKPNKYLTEAVDWFKRNGIPLYGIQRNPDQGTWTTSPKAYGQLIIDDAAIGCPLIVGEHERPYVDWNRVRKHLSESGILPYRPTLEKSGASKMKTKIFSTEKADIMVVDLPEGTFKVMKSDDDLWYWHENEGKPDIEDNLFPEGNWQPLIFDEETAKEIEEYIPEVCGYYNYLAVDEDCVFDTVLESLQSLIEVNVQKVNPLGDEPPSASEMFDGMTNMEHADDYEAWCDAEVNVFHNPFYFFKLK